MSRVKSLNYMKICNVVVVREKDRKKKKNKLNELK